PAPRHRDTRPRPPRPWPRPGARPGPPGPLRAGASRRSWAGPRRTAGAAGPAVRAGRARWKRGPAGAWAGSVHRGRAGALDLEQLLVDLHAPGVDRIAHLPKLLQRRVLAVLLQPQALAQHLLHGFTHRVAVAAGHRLDFRAGRAQPLLEGVGGVQDLGQGPLAPPGAAAPGDECDNEQGRREQRQESSGHGRFRAGWTPSLTRASARGKSPGQARTWV